jgi:hypothetical protein
MSWLVFKISPKSSLSSLSVGNRSSSAIFSRGSASGKGVANRVAGLREQVDEVPGQRSEEDGGVSPVAALHRQVKDVGGVSLRLCAVQNRPSPVQS